VVSNAVRDKGSNTALNKGSNVENATREVLDNVDPFTKAGLQLKTGFKPDALYPLGGAAQNAVIAKEENKGSTSLSSIRRIRDALAGRRPEPLTATEIMTQYDKGRLPKQQPDTETRVVGTTAGEVNRIALYGDELSAKSRSIVEAQRRVDGAWVRDPSAIVRVTETKSTETKPIDAIRTKFDTYVRAEASKNVSETSKTQPGGQATITNQLYPTPSTDPESYIPRGMNWEDLSRDRVSAVRDTKIVTSGVAIFPSDIGNVYRKIDKFNNPPIKEVPLGSGAPNWSGNGVKTLGVQSNDDFVQAYGAKSVLTTGYGSWTVRPDVVDLRGTTGSWGPYP
jgi:hypothetical protein